MLIIIPHKGVDGVEFGMTRQEVAQVVGEVPRRGRRNKFDASDFDFFDIRGFFVYYDATDRCHAIEFTRDAHVAYDGYELFAHPAHEVLDWAHQQDHAIDAKDGFVSRALGLSMYAPMIDEPDLTEAERSEPAESFMIFRAGYHDEEQQRLKEDE